MVHLYGIPAGLSAAGCDSVFRELQAARKGGVGGRREAPIASMCLVVALCPMLIITNRNAVHFGPDHHRDAASFETLASPFDGLRTSSLLGSAANSVSLRRATQSPVSKGTENNCVAFRK